jgi:cysteine desulfurase
MRKKIYLDYAATTPVDKRVKEAMEPFLSEKFGNTMSLHSFGQEAKTALEEAREIISDLMGAKPNEVIFTSSATESNNLALKGVAFANKERGKHIIISSIEHPCILESAKWLETQGFEITKIKVDKYGIVNLDELEKSIKKDTILVSIMHANNEIGTIQPIEKVSKIIKAQSSKLKAKTYFHTDAAQTFGKIPVNVKELGVDLMTVSSHKMYGPKGVGALYIKEGTKIEPILHGGGHEMGFRSSTVNVAGIVGFARACEISKNEMEKEAKRLKKLKDKLIKGILNKIPGSHLNSHPEKSLPNIVNFWFEGVDGESLVIQLDLMGIAVSTGSACSTQKLEPSHVLLAIGLKEKEIQGSLRISFGRFTKEKDIDYFLKILPKVIERVRKL